MIGFDDGFDLLIMGTFGRAQNVNIDALVRQAMLDRRAWLQKLDTAALTQLDQVFHRHLCFNTHLRIRLVLNARLARAGYSMP